MSTKVLLKENNAAAESKIHFLNSDYQRGLKLIDTLKKIGFVGIPTDWQEVEKHFHTNPDWTLDFCLQSKGYLETFTEAKKLFSVGNRYEPITEAEKEAVKEQHRVYATEKQAEALELVNSVANDLNKLKVLGFAVNFGYASQLFYPLRQTQDFKVEVSDEALLPYLLKLE
jgi:hypothetical protein